MWSSEAASAESAAFAGEAASNASSARHTRASARPPRFGRSLETVTEIEEELIIVLCSTAIQRPAGSQNVVRSNQVVQAGGAVFRAGLVDESRADSLEPGLHVEAKFVAHLPGQGHGLIGSAAARAVETRIPKVHPEWNQWDAGQNEAAHIVQRRFWILLALVGAEIPVEGGAGGGAQRSEEHTSELQSLRHLVCRLLLEK